MLENESRDLKVKIRELEERLESKPREDLSIPIERHISSSDGQTTVGVDNAYLTSHIQSLHDTIGM